MTTPNPQDVGGQWPAFPPLPKHYTTLKVNGAPLFDAFQLHQYAMAYGELCRAAPAGGDERCTHLPGQTACNWCGWRAPVSAPAGGDPVCPECKAPGLLFECVACSHSNYPKDSAPAVSATSEGDVEVEFTPLRDPFADTSVEAEELLDELIDSAMSDRDMLHNWDTSEATKKIRSALLSKLSRVAVQEGMKPAPNWCRTCGRRPDDPMAIFCSDSFHIAASQRQEGGSNG